MRENEALTDAASVTRMRGTGNTVFKSGEHSLWLEGPQEQELALASFPHRDPL